MIARRINSLDKSKHFDRILELDGIRGIAVLMVLVFHFFRGGALGAEHGSIWAYFYRLTLHGWSGVDLFFVLSGFLIARILLRFRKSKKLIGAFYIRRACRILPVYCVVLAMHFLFRAYYNEYFPWIFSNNIPDWTYFLFLQNVAMGIDGQFTGHFLGVTWSLAVEEQFYLVLPLIIIFLPRKTAFAICITLLFLAPAIRLLQPGMSAYVNMPMRMDALIAGVMISFITTSTRAWKFIEDNFASVYAAFIGLSFGIFAAIVMGNKMEQLGHLWFALFYTCFVLIAIFKSGSWITAPLRSQVLRYCGGISYGLYLYHHGILAMFHAWFCNGRQPSVLSQWSLIVTIFALVTTFIISTISFYAFELAFQKFGRRFKYE